MSSFAYRSLTSACLLALCSMPATAVWAQSAPAAHEEVADDGAPPVAISTTAWEGRVKLSSDHLTRAVSDSLNRPGLKVGASFTHKSGFVADAELATVSKKVFPNGTGADLTVGAGWRGGVPEGWHYGVGLAYEFFPEAKVTAPANYNSALVAGAAQQYGVDMDTAAALVGQAMGSATPVHYKQTTTRFNTAYALVELGYGNLYGRLMSVLSRDYRGGNTSTICGTLFQLDPNGTAGPNCYAGGTRHTRGSLLLDLDYKIQLQEATSLNLHAGYQRVRNFSDLNYYDLGIGLTHQWQGFEWALEASKPFTKNHALFTAMDGADVKQLDKAKLVVSVTKRF